jgi:hypothetical protein
LTWPIRCKWFETPALSQKATRSRISSVKWSQAIKERGPFLHSLNQQHNIEELLPLYKNIIEKREAVPTVSRRGWNSHLES